MAKKGQTYHTYTEEFKSKAVERYINGDGSYQSLSDELGLRSSTQLKKWVKQYEEGKTLADQRGNNSSSDSPFKGRPKTKFTSVEEERDYYKAQIEYLKKRYPNLHGEVKLNKH
ncbi:transposase [Bacillus sp. CGMCC 1.16607]|uniref:transposase n=1 Tax=Bacillus sp. CGMCC 1.16607 TaxID=3351842 RepID=UPI00363E767C